jgi:hypothetical protein
MPQTSFATLASYLMRETSSRHLQAFFHQRGCARFSCNAEAANRAHAHGLGEGADVALTAHFDRPA